MDFNLRNREGVRSFMIAASWKYPWRHRILSFFATWIRLMRIWKATIGIYEFETNKLHSTAFSLRLLACIPIPHTLEPRLFVRNVLELFLMCFSFTLCMIRTDKMKTHMLSKLLSTSKLLFTQCTVAQSLFHLGIIGMTPKVAMFYATYQKESELITVIEENWSSLRMLYRSLVCVMSCISRF